MLTLLTFDRSSLHLRIRSSRDCTRLSEPALQLLSIPFRSSLPP